MWMKWRHKYADGGPGDFEWAELRSSSREEAQQEAKEVALELAAEEGYISSEHYRGVAYELFEMPPKEVLEVHLARAEIAVRGYQKRVEELKNQILKVCESPAPK